MMEFNVYNATLNEFVVIDFKIRVTSKEKANIPIIQITRQNKNPKTIFARELEDMNIAWSYQQNSDLGFMSHDLGF